MREVVAYAEHDVICEDDFFICLHNLRFCIMQDVGHSLRVACLQGRGGAYSRPLTLISVLHAEWLDFKAYNSRQLSRLVHVHKNVESQVVVQCHFGLLALFCILQANDLA